MSSSHFRACLLAALLALMTIALYWPATHHDFVNFDDNDYVTTNLQVQKGLTWENLKWAFCHPVSANWHPVTMLSHMLDCQLFGVKPWGHHLTSLLLHAANAVLVFLLLYRLTGATWRSWLVAALFAVHPLRVESVAWIAERKDVLSLFFGLLTLYAYARYAQKVTSGKCQVTGKEEQGEETFNIQRSTFNAKNYYWLALGFFALGLMSKPMLVTLPFVMLLLDYWPLGRVSSDKWRVTGVRKSFLPFSILNPQFSALLLEKLPFAVLSLASCIVTFLVQRHGGAFGIGAHLSPGERIGNALVSYCRYLGKTFWPADLAVFYPYTGHWPVVQVLLAGGLMLGITMLAFMARRSYPFWLVGWLWFVGTLVPVIGLVQVGDQAMADRYTYLPSLGLLVLVVWGGFELACRWRCRVIALAVAVLAVIVVLLGLTRVQLGYWQNGETLFRHATQATRNNYLAHAVLGMALEREGQIDAAVSQYQEAIRLKPGNALLHYNLGSTFGRKGRLDEAIRELQEAIRLSPGYAEAHNNLGLALKSQGQIDGAIVQYQVALRLKPDFAEADYNLGVMLAAKGRLDEAIRCYQEALRLKPDYALASLNLGNVLERKGQIDAAIKQYQETIRLKPDYAEAHYNLGTALGEKGQLDEAISEYREAIRLKPDFAEAHNYLGNDLNRKGQIDEAISQYQEAVRLKPDYAEAHFNLGNTLGRKGQINEAITQLQEAVRLEPDYAPLHFNLGNVLNRTGRIDESIVQYQEVIRLKPDYAEAHNNLGTAYYKQGQIDAALAQYQEAVRLKPDYAEARFNLDHLLAMKNAPAAH